MKILFYINVLSGGGAERVVANLASFLSESNDVTIINSFKTDNEYDVRTEVERVYIDKNDYSSRLKKNVNRIRFLRLWIKKNQPDVCISLMAEPNLRLSIATIGIKTKTIISVRNDPAREYSGKFSRYLARFFFQRVDGCVFQTEDAKLFFSQKLQNKSRIVLNPVNPLFFDNERKPIEGNIVMIGRLTHQKNYPMSLEAFSILKERQINAKLHIYGDGTEKESLVELIQERHLDNDVFLHGFSEDIPHILRTADLFLLSSDYEGMPNALMEALACGVPSIATNCPCGGPKALIQDKINGILVGTNDALALAEAIETLLCDSEYKQMLLIMQKNPQSDLNPLLFLINFLIIYVM